MFIFFQESCYRDRGICPLRCIFRAVRTEVPLSSIGLVSTNYITMSIFLAFAAIYPDMEVLLYFVLPIKMKWMALVYAVMALYYFITGGIVSRVAIAASLLNFVIFFPVQQEYAPFRPERTGPEGEIQKAVKTAYDLRRRS